MPTTLAPPSLLLGDPALPAAVCLLGWWGYRGHPPVADRGLSGDAWAQSPLSHVRAWMAGLSYRMVLGGEPG